jgi:hypothetical protein
MERGYGLIIIRRDFDLNLFAIQQVKMIRNSDVSCMNQAKEERYMCLHYQRATIERGKTW